MDFDKVTRNGSDPRHWIGMIADDLTGANDAGVQFASKGLATAVLFDTALRTNSRLLAADALVVDTDSRALSVEESYQKAYQAADWLQKAGVRHVYKKIDSSLRGNWGAELDAVTDVFQPDFAVIAPAYPRMGRTTRNGVHFIRGVPVDQTEMARDPKTPVTDSDLLRLLKRQSSRMSLRVGVRDLEHLPEKMREWRIQGIERLVFDAETDDHLRRIAAAVARSGYRVVWVGSAGLAEWLPDALELSRKESGDSVPESEPHSQVSNVLVVAGSMSSVTRKQMIRLTQAYDVLGLELDPSSMIEPTWEARQKTYIDTMEKAFLQGKDVVLSVETGEESVERTFRCAAERGWSRVQVSLCIARRLGELTVNTVRSRPELGLVMTGGDTARAICNGLGVEGFYLLEEVEPGIPLGRLVGGCPLYAVTKAGAFGSENALIRAVKQLKGSENR